MLESLEHDRISEDGEFLWASCLKEATKGFGEEPCSREEMDRRHGAGRWASVPSFCHTQANGKQRRIDNGKRGLQNAWTRFLEKLRLCTAIQPLIVVKLFLLLATTLGINLQAEGFDFESGTEDMPDAYRYVPCSTADLNVNVVAVRHPETLVWFFV